MFDFSERRTICIEGLKNAYRVGLYGDHPKVLDGSWRELFDDEAEGPTEGNQDDVSNYLVGREDDLDEALGELQEHGTKRKRSTNGTLDDHFSTLKGKRAHKG